MARRDLSWVNRLDRKDMRGVGRKNCVASPPRHAVCRAGLAGFNNVFKKSLRVPGHVQEKKTLLGPGTGLPMSKDVDAARMPVAA